MFPCVLIPLSKQAPYRHTFLSAILQVSKPVNVATLRSSNECACTLFFRQPWRTRSLSCFNCKAPMQGRPCD